MTINEIRKEVCKRANDLIKFGYPKGWSFKWAWDKIKKELNQIKFADLKIGDRISIEYGDYDNFFDITVKSIVPSKMLKGYFEITGETEKGQQVEFCTDTKSSFDKAA